MSMRIESLHAGYGGGRMVVRDLSLEIGAGITALLGPNGCGKTTLLRAIGGMLADMRGGVAFDGNDLLAMNAPERARRVALIPQTPSVAGAFSVREVVALGRFAVGRDADAVERAMEQAEVMRFAESMFHELSAGQQQRVTLARALAQLDGNDSTPRLLLADEPFSAMDPARALLCAAVLRRLRDRGVTVVLVAHDFTASARLADRAVVLDSDGAVVAQGDSAAVIAPEPLERAFGVPFERLEGESGVVVVPRGG